MWTYFFAIWVVVYIVSVLNNAFTWLQVKKCKRKIRAFGIAFTTCPSHGFSTPDTYTKQLSAMLEYYPVIVKYVNYPSLSYSDNDSDTYHKAEKLFAEFQMLTNFKWHAFLESLNPLHSLLTILYFPTHIARAFGTNLSKSLNFLIDIAIGVVCGFLESELSQLVDVSVIVDFVRNILEAN